MKQSNNKNWIIAILIVICCLLVSVIFVKIEDAVLLNFLSGFSTLLSIVLSVLAIFYTFITGMESQRVNSNIDKEISNIKGLIDRLDSDIKHNKEIQNQTLALSEQVEKTIDTIKVSDENKSMVNELEGLKIQIKAINQNFHKNLEDKK
mgnify:CR=1 FL=1